MLLNTIKVADLHNCLEDDNTRQSRAWVFQQVHLVEDNISV